MEVVTGRLGTLDLLDVWLKGHSAADRHQNDKHQNDKHQKM